MGLFEKWREEAVENVGAHSLVVLSSDGKPKVIAAVVEGDCQPVRLESQVCADIGEAREGGGGGISARQVADNEG